MIKLIGRTLKVWLGIPLTISLVYGIWVLLSGLFAGVMAWNGILWIIPIYVYLIPVIKYDYQQRII